MEKIELWREDTPISRWNKSRKKLNKIIRKYNKWVGEGSYSANKGVTLIKKINKRLDADYCNQYRRTSYKKELKLIKSLVKRRLSEIL